MGIVDVVCVHEPGSIEADGCRAIDPTWYAWELANPVMFDDPIPAKGNWSLWVPSERVVATIEKRLGTR